MSEDENITSEDDENPHPSTSQQNIMSGEPLVIVSFNKDGSCNLHEENLEKILLQDDVKDRLLVVVSVVGKFRQGKSFLQTFMLNHMQHQNENSNWMDDTDVLLPGFKWENSFKRVTNGIHMWSKPITVKLPTEEEVAVVFMDTQGVFDLESQSAESRLVFAISTMMSSVQIYNLRAPVGSEDLEHFRCFAAYAKLTRDANQPSTSNTTQNDTAKKQPFQHLWFLIRDWTSTNDHKYGAEGGNEYLKYLHSTEFCKKRNIGGTHEYNPEDYGETIEKLIDSCFTQNYCFLLPTPGDKVTSSNFEGKLSDINEDFKKYILDFMKKILNPSNLEIKMIGGHQVKAIDFIPLIKVYVEKCKDGKLPPTTIMKEFREWLDEKECRKAEEKCRLDEKNRRKDEEKRRMDDKKRREEVVETAGTVSIVASGAGVTSILIAVALEGAAAAVAAAAGVATGGVAIVAGAVFGFGTLINYFKNKNEAKKK